MQNYEHKFKTKKGEQTVEVGLYESVPEIVSNLSPDFIIKTINNKLVQDAEKRVKDRKRPPRLSKTKRAAIAVNVFPLEKLQQIFTDSECDNAVDALAEYMAQPEQVDLLIANKDAGFLKG